MPIGMTEALLIAGAIVLLFGASRLPQVMGALGKGIREFKRAVREDDEPKKQTKEREEQGEQGEERQVE
ncbi:MAG: twin-arginine translocase TatA/TatE family subunit [Armatimonadota bacterium]|nr:twin-arginine translocase TatA/TatE family subunit [Armatimonadota bacterium]MCX7776960.1 twin-arginine translocase TatA/TatE family subunit [Armatimonadota bacterium]MDW8024794.1 twin-arginine translocase TatA/TatE family subunit [Armatimonadota bacterium]